MSSDDVVMVSGDRDLVTAVQAAGAAAGTPVGLVDVAALATVWQGAGAVLVGADVAQAVADCALPGRGSVYLVCTEEGRSGACEWSMPLAAAVIALPDGGRWLSHVLSRSSTGGRDGQNVVAVVGGSGGVGASTLAAGLAVAATRDGRRAALIDVDPLGGGADLLFGVEAVPGWRWNRLRSARGQLGDLSTFVPAAEGVSVVAMSRVGETDVGRDAVGAVVDTLRRTHDLVVLDVGRSLGAAEREGLRLADATVLVAGQDVRSVAAARMVLAEADLAPAGAVVRLKRGAGVSPATVSGTLGLKLLGTVPDDKELAVAAEQGVPPGRGRRPWSAACRRILAHLLPSAQPVAMARGWGR